MLITYSLQYKDRLLWIVEAAHQHSGTEDKHGIQGRLSLY